MIEHAREHEPEHDPPIVANTRDGVATLWLNRPQQLNALSDAMLEGLQRELDRLAEDRSVRCIVLAAHGRAFSAGHDLGEMRRRQRDYESCRELFARCSRVMQSIRALPVPVIARVQGLATAAGCQLVGGCDLAIAVQTARFAVSGINVGLFCSTPSVALARNVATKRAFDLLVTGRFIDAPTACAWGLINESVPPDELDAAVERKVREIVAKSPAAIRHGKAMFYRQLAMPLPQAYELAGEVMARNMLEDDVAEGIDAFLERRTPVWKS